MQHRGAATFGGGEPTIADAIRAFVRRYGWRAYALPVLVVVTAVALATMRNPTPAAPPADRTVADGAQTQLRQSPTAPLTTPKSSVPSGTAAAPLVKGAILPAGPAYTKVGLGTFTRIPGASKVFGEPSDGHGVWRYDIEVETGITGIDVAQFASLVQSVLADPRSWSGHGVALQRVNSGPIDFHITLTSAMTVRQFCGYSLKVEASCYATAGSGPGLDVNRVVLNDARWARGSAQFPRALNAYRIYMINHEDGHAVGHHHAHNCLPGGLAPVMMQQSLGLKSAATGKTCGANPWPYPPGARGAPGAEQADTAQNNELNLR